MVEGLAAMDDHSNDGIKVAKHIAGGNPKSRNTVLLQPMIAPAIAVRPIAHIMRHAVDLDRHSRTLAIEIEDIGSAGMLAPEFEAVGSEPKHSP